MTEQKEPQPLALSDLRHLCGIMEEAGFDVPFATFTWTHWQELQTRTLLGFCRFQRAITSRNPQLAAFIALEMQQMVMDLNKEICSWLESEPHEESEMEATIGRNHE